MSQDNDNQTIKVELNCGETQSNDNQSVIEEPKIKADINEEKPKKRRGNPQNLTSKGYFATLTKEQMQEIGRKGAEASNKVQAKNRKIREIARIIGNTLVDPKNPKSKTYNEALVVA